MSEEKDTMEEKTTDTDVKVPAKFKKIVTEIESMSVIDLNELVKIFEQKFGVSAAAVAVAGPAEKGEGADDSGGLVSIELVEAGSQKIQVIKVVKDLLALGLKEAKDFVDGAPKILKEGANKEEAEEIKTKIEGAGGKVSIK